jgi:hypothetical protein
MTANLKTESDMHYCLHIIKSPDTCSFCCVSNHYMYYYYYYFILPWNCPSLISKLIIIIILFSRGIVRHLSQTHYYHYFILPWNCPSLISKLIIIIILFSHGIVRHLSQSSNFMKLHMNVIHYV